MLRLKPNRIGTFTTTGEELFVSFAAKLLRCHATIDFSINPLSARNRALSCITTFPRSFHSSTSEDDTFSELGSPMPKAPTHARKLKLMTEKPEPYLKTNRTKRPSRMPSESRIRLKDNSSILGSDWEVVVRSFGRSIDPPEEEEEVTIRITNINSETTDSAVHSMCTSCGSLEGLVRTKEDAVDALFSVKDKAGIKSIIKKLNETMVNGHKWSADLHGRDSSAEVRSKQSNANYDLRLEISRQLADVRREVTRKTVCIQDLECLHNSLLHLEGEAHPHTTHTR
ncbi:hypothetical protein ACFX13_008405 [Malus domestica]